MSCLHQEPSIKKDLCNSDITKKDTARLEVVALILDLIFFDVNRRGFPLLEFC